MVKAKAAGKAKMFIEFITSKRLTAHDRRPERIHTISYFKKGKRSTPRVFPIISARSGLYATYPSSL